MNNYPPIKIGKLDLSKFPGCVGPSRPIEPPTIYKPGYVREDGKIFSHYHEHNLYWPVFITKEQLEKRQAKKQEIARKASEAYYADHEASKAAARENYRKNRNRILAKAATRREICPATRYERLARALISGSFKRKSYTKSGRTEALLGCTLAEFRAHIENQLLPGMTADNRGDWHIDHIVPCALARSREEVAALCHYTNLRPLWSGANQAKKARLVEVWQLPENLHPTARAIYDRAAEAGHPLVANACINHLK